MTDTLMEEMTFPLDHGCKLHVLRTYPDTEDEKFICTLYDASDEVIFMPEPDFGDVEEIKVYSSTCVAEAIHTADRCVARLNKEKVRKLLADGIDHLTQAM